MKSRLKGFRIGWLGFSFLLVSLPQGVMGAPAISSLSGYAELALTYRGNTYRFGQAARVETDPATKKLTGTFQALDDFGNTLYQLHFVGDKTRLRRVPLPLKKEEILSYFLYRLPPSTKDLKITLGKKGELVEVEKKGKYKIVFRDVKKTGRVSYPYTLSIISKKVSLTVSWQKLTLHTW